mmetsp:Transcript_13058/g.11544  ORF Transcript_13058/g.11544 Transcript_13058/m.11544 type:complete len:118 (-) Transcript_13058:27-380(-)
MNKIIRNKNFLSNPKSKPNSPIFTNNSIIDPHHLERSNFTSLDPQKIDKSEEESLNFLEPKIISGEKIEFKNNYSVHNSVISTKENQTYGKLKKMSLREFMCDTKKLTREYLNNYKY